MFVVLNLGVIAWFGADLEKDRFGFLKNLKTWKQAESLVKPLI